MIPFIRRKVTFGFMMYILFIAAMAIIAIIVLWGFRIWTQKYAEIPQINKDFNGYVGVDLTITNFDLQDKTITCKADYLLSYYVEQAIEKTGQSDPIKMSLYSIDNDQLANVVMDDNKLAPVTTPEPGTFPSIIVRGSGVIRVRGWTLESDTNWPIGTPTDCSAILGGNDFNYPFDKYNVTLLATMNVPPGIPSPTGNNSLNQTDEMPFTFSVGQYLQGYNVKVRPVAGSDNTIEITIERNWLEIALTLSITCILFLASILAFIYSFSLLRSGKTVDIWALIAMVGLLVAIPSTRSVIIPSQIQGRTLIDLILLACTCFLIFGLAVLIFRYRKQNKQN
jgi:hypothetical protein